MCRMHCFWLGFDLRKIVIIFMNNKHVFAVAGSQCGSYKIPGKDKTNNNALKILLLLLL
jgi:hypothetical protein